MVIRRGAGTDIAWFFARLEMNCLSTGDVLIAHRGERMLEFMTLATQSSTWR